jgi:hypothetical protein
MIGETHLSLIFDGVKRLAYTTAKRPLTASIFLISLWVLIACNDIEAEIVTPAPEPSPTCETQPQPTGEKVILATVEAYPAFEYAPGDVVSLTFSGNYLITNNAIICGEEHEIVGYIYSDQLDRWSWEREVTVSLGDRELERIRCEYTCEIEAAIPEDTLPNGYTLIVNSWIEDISFQIVVTEPNE